MKNRCHWDVTGSVTDFESAGATVLADPDPDPGHGWTVMADPDGNEFSSSRSLSECSPLCVSTYDGGRRFC